MRYLLIASISSLLMACAAPKAPEPTGAPFPINPIHEVEHVKAP